MDRSPWPGGRRLVALRERRSRPGRAAELWDIADSVGAWAARGPLTVAGNDLVRVEASSEGVAAYLDAVETARAAGDLPVFSLASGTGPDDAIVFYDWEDGGTHGMEQLWLPLVRRDGPPAVALAARIARLFSASVVFLEDPAIVALTRARRAVQRALDRIPEQRREDAMPPDLPSVDPAVPQLLVPEEYDRRRAPDGVWWINVWDRSLVQSVGERRVRGASWAQVTDLDDGALLLLATPHELDVASAADRQTLARLLVELDVRGVQERWRVTAPSR